MPTPNLLVVCSLSFLVVFVVLAFLAGLMRALILLTPEAEERAGGIEPSVVTAITEGVKAAYPGAKVTDIEEVK